MKTIYTGLLLCDQGTEVLLSTISPRTNSTIYQVHFRHQRTSGLIANTLKLRIFLHYSEKNQAGS
jgi:hypothetical protein